MLPHPVTIMEEESWFTLFVCVIGVAMFVNRWSRLRAFPRPTFSLSPSLTSFPSLSVRTFSCARALAPQRDPARALTSARAREREGTTSLRPHSSLPFKLLFYDDDSLVARSIAAMDSVLENIDFDYRFTSFLPIKSVSFAFTVTCLFFPLSLRLLFFLTSSLAFRGHSPSSSLLLNLPHV